MKNLKTEFFRFLSETLFQVSDGEIISAFDDTVTSVHDADVTLMNPTDHEEADTRVSAECKRHVT